MNGNLSAIQRKNIWEILHKRGATMSTFEQWDDNFTGDIDIQRNVHNYLQVNDYDVTENFNEWTKNVIGERGRTIIHASSDAMEDQIGTKWINMEENAEDFFNKHYQSQGFNVDFRQSKVGHNALQLWVNGKEVGDDIILKKGGKAVDFKDLQAHVALRIEDAFGSLENSVKKDMEIVNKISDLNLKENILDFDLTGMNQAEFAHALDKAFNPDKLVKNWYFEKKEGAGNIYQAGVNRISTGGEYNGKQYEAGEIIEELTQEEIGYDWWSGKADNKFGDRLSTEQDQSYLMGVKQRAGELLTLGEYDQYLGNIDGGIKLDDGTYVPYSYIWDKRKELMQTKTNGLGLERKFIKKDGKLVEIFEYSEGSDVDLLFNEKISDEYHGSEKALDAHIDDNAWIYLDTQQEKTIRDLHIELENIEDEGKREEVEKEIKKLWKEVYPSLSDSDIEDLTLYNENGEFLRIKKPKIEDRGDDVSDDDIQIEADAENLAREYITDLDYLIKKRQEAYLRLILLAKRAHTNIDKISEETHWASKGLGSLFDWSNDRLATDISQLDAVNTHNDIFIGEPGEGLSSVSTFEGDMKLYREGITTVHHHIPRSVASILLDAPGEVKLPFQANATLSTLPGKSELAEEYNQALLDFKTLTRAVDLNLDINQTPEENFWVETIDNLGKSIGGAGIVSDQSEDDARDAFRGILEYDGYEVPEHVIESSFWKNGRLGKNNIVRSRIEGSSRFVTDMAPLLIELAVFKKAGGLKKLQTMFGPKSRIVTRLTKGKVFQNKATRFVVDEMISPGVVVALEWSAAESLGEVVTGGAWKAHTINWETGETNLTMPFTMGMSGGVFRLFSQTAMKGFERTTFGRRILAHVKEPLEWHNRTTTGAFLKTYGTVIPKSIGQGAVGTGLLVVSETSQAIMNDLIKHGKVDWAEKWKKITDTEHLIQTWVAMTVLSGKDVLPRAREAFRLDVANLRRNVAATNRAHKELKLNEKSTEKEINTAVESKLREVYESDLSIKEINIKVEEIRQMERDLIADKMIKDSKEAAIADGKYYEDFVKPRYENIKNIQTKPVNEWTIEDYNEISKLTHNELYNVLRRSGIEPNTKEFEFAEGIYETISHLQKTVDFWEIDAKLPKFREEYIRNTLSTMMNTTRIKDLKNKIKEGKDTPQDKLELKRLEDSNKEIFERTETIFARAEKEFGVKLDAEVASAKVLAESLGANIRTYGKGGEFSSKDWKFEEADGAYNPKTGEIHLNLDVIRETKNLGAPIHEVIHHVLRNSLKYKSGKKKGLITANGIKIIDGLMQKLSSKDRDIIEKRIEEKYKYDEVTGKEKNKNEYYEEYITGIGDAIKNKKIKYNQSTARKMGTLIYPILKPLMPNLYNYKLSKTKSAEASKDLWNMLGDIHLSSASRRVQTALQKLGGKRGVEGRKVAGIVKESYSKSTSKFKDPVNKIGEKIDGKKFTTENALIELYGKDGKGLLSQLVNTKLKPFEKLPDFSYEDMVSEAIIESMAHIRGFKPEMKIEGTEFGLYGHIESQLTNKIKNVLKTGKVAKKEFEKEIGEEGVKDIEAEQRTAEEILDAKLAAEAKVETAPNLRKSLVNNKGEVGIKNSDAIVETVKNAVVKTLGQKLPTATTKDFKLNLQTSYKAFLKKPVADMMGTRMEYDNFLRNNHLVLQKFIPVSRLVQLERNVKAEDRIFTTEEARLTKIKDIKDAIDKGLIDPNISETAGNKLYTKKNYTEQQWFDFFRGKDVGSSTKGTRKDALAEIIATEMAFDMTIEVAKSPEMIERRREIDNKTNEQVQVEIAEMAKRIDRDPNMKFSISSKDKKHKKVQSAAELVVNANKLLGIAKEKGYNVLFDSRGVLRKEFDKYNFDQMSVSLIREQFSGDKLNVELNLAEIGFSQKYLQEIGKRKKVKVSDVIEQIPMEMGRILGEKFGLIMKTTRIEEGGVADFNAEINGIEWNVETKAFKHQMPRNKVGTELDFSTGLGWKISESLPIEVRVELVNAMNSAKNGLKKYNDFIVAEMNKLGLKIDVVKNNTLIPVEVWNKAQELGFQPQTSVNVPFKNGLQYISYKYANKKLTDGTPAPNFDINIMSVKGKELGLYSISDYSPHGLNLPKLEVADGGIVLTGRFSAGSSTPMKAPKGYEKFHKPGQKYYRPNWTFIPKIDPYSIKNKSEFSLDNKSKFLKFLKSPGYQRFLKLNPKEAVKLNTDIMKGLIGPKYSKTNKKQVIEDIRTIDNAIKLSRSIKREKKGMSTWDFDDTLATTKSGVRAKIPNPSGLPKPKRKVIFLAGGAGSGKSNVVKKLELEKQGFKIVNQDISLEWLKKNSGLPENMNDLTSTQRSTLGKLSHQAREIARRKMMKFQGNAEGVVVDGTGGSMKAMEKLVKEFKDKGYDVSMLFVETSLKTALERNKARKERSLLDKIVERNHAAVQGNKSGFKTMFAERFMEVKTDKLKQEDAMPSELVDKMNEFVSGYEKIRLDAEQFATEGKDILDRGGEFDFSEFNKVVKGAPGPMFKTAMDRAKKFGTKDTYVLTARPAESAGPIYEFLKSQGLEIPRENITGLGNSTAEAKALWMLKKFEEGYNDIYFADDAMQNVKAVKDVLSQLDVKSRVQQVIRGEEVKVESTESVKDTNRLSDPKNYDNIKYSKSHRTEYEKTISKHRPDLVKEGKVSQTIDAMFDFVDGLNVPGNKKRKYEQVTTKWLATSNIKLKEDAYKIEEAVRLAEKYKEDIFSYTNPNAIIEKYAGKAKAKPTDPKTIKEFTEGTVTNKKHGITEHIVENTKEGQLAVRKVIDTHFGEKSNPWCLAQKKDGKLTENSWEMWEHYSDGPKSLVFQNGKLIGFKANEQYWDRMDNATDAPVINIKDGRVTKTVELVPIGEGKAQEFVMETRTVSKDKKTVKTEYHVTKNIGEESVFAGDYKIENRVNGQTVKETEYRPDGTKYNEKFFKNGKTVEARVFQPDGRTSSINNIQVDVNKYGDRITHEITEGKTDYWFGEVSMEAKGLKDVPSEHQQWVQGVAKNIYPIGFKTKKGFEVMDIMERVDGKLRVNFDKLRKIDPDVKGLPKETTGVEQFKFSKSKKNLSKDFNKILEESYGVGAEKTYSEAKARLVGKGKGKFRTPGSEDFMGLVTYAFSGKGKQGEMHQEFFREHLERPFSRAYNEIHSIKQNISNNYKALRKEMPNVRKRLNDVIDGVFTVDQAIRVHLWDKAGFEIPGLSKTDLKTLTEYVRKDSELTLFAEQLSQITMLKDGYLKPKSYWLGENITMDMNNTVDRVYRKDALTEFTENREAIFGKWEGGRIVGPNMNKIEAIRGPKHREALENILWRMENGTNRTVGADSNTNKWMNWVNDATGTIMFFNQKSATLQTISSLNYVNGSFNNPFRAAQAFANQPQYWKDFAKIFNSDLLVQRRAGLKINIEAAELLERIGNKKGGFARFRAFLLEKGFIPTKYADSFAIASGGATYYRNSIRKYKKEGLSTKEAEAKAWEDFTLMTEQTQQSSRPDLISMQQASALGRPILAFANTPMQMFRRHKRRIQDIANKRGNTAENVASALYYGVAQTMIFSYLANAMFAVDDESDDPEDIKFAESKKSRHINTILDSYLRGMGTGGATVAALKNGVLSFTKESKKDYKADYGNTIIEMLNVSPPIGSKSRKVYRALKSYYYDKEVMEEMDFNLDNPAVLASANVISALTNVPVDRVVMKLNNIKDATTGDFENWQRIAMFMGISKWSLGEFEDESDIIKSRIREEKEETKQKEKEQEDKAIEEGFINDQKKEREQNKNKLKKEDITCAGVKSSGERCGIKVKGNDIYCTIHQKVEQRKDGKKSQCKKIKSDKTRCKIETSSKSGYCYYHD